MDATTCWARSLIHVSTMTDLDNHHDEFAIMHLRHEAVPADTVSPQTRQVPREGMTRTTRIVAIDEVLLDPRHHLRTLDHVEFVEVPAHGHIQMADRTVLNSVQSERGAAHPEHARPQAHGYGLVVREGSNTHHRQGQEDRCDGPVLPVRPQVVRKDLDIGRSYLSGRFGALPDIGNDDIL